MYVPVNALNISNLAINREIGRDSCSIIIVVAALKVNVITKL